jgi:signal transduction histidine kinase
VELPFSPRRRAERLIAAGRVVLAASSLAALWRDPSEPAKYAQIAYALLAGYLAYALILAILRWRRPPSRGIQELFEHCFDLIFFSIFMYFTSGPASPFIAYFVFSLVCATLRWQWKGTLWTAVASLSTFLALGYYFADVLHDPTFELNEWVIRGVYMAVVAILLGHLGRHEQRTRQEMALLAGWPGRTGVDSTSYLRDLLGHVARIHSVSRVAVAWSPSGAAGSSLAVLDGELMRQVTFDRPLAALVDPALAAASFLARKSEQVPADLLVHGAGQPGRWRGDPLAAPLREALATAGVLVSAPWQGELGAGRLFVLDLPDPSTDDLVLAEVVATMTGAGIESLLLLERMRAGAAAEERMRLARDLHDGVLQSLTGFGLRLAAARRLLPGAPDEAERSLAALQQLLTGEQRDLRFFIRDLEPPKEAQPEFDLARRLTEFVHRAEQEWQLDVELEANLADEDMPEAAEKDVYFLVREALVNAVRHGHARRVAVRLDRSAADKVTIRVADDGSGFPFRGRFDACELARLAIGPRSLRERVTSVGGRLVLESAPSGVCLEIEIPLAGGLHG